MGVRLRSIVLGGWVKEELYLKICCFHQGSTPIVLASAAKCNDPEQGMYVGAHLLVSFHASMQGGNLSLAWPINIFHAPSPSNRFGHGLMAYIRKNQSQS